MQPKDVINTPITLEFLGLNERALVRENNLEQAILDNLQQQDLETYVETLDEDLNDLEDEIYDTNCCCEEDFVEMNCPVCHEDVSFEADILDAKEDIEVTCPHCGSVVYDTVIDCDYTDLHSIEHDEYDEHHYCGSHHHPGL